MMNAKYDITIKIDTKTDTREPDGTSKFGSTISTLGSNGKLQKAAITLYEKTVQLVYDQVNQSNGTLAPGYKEFGTKLLNADDFLGSVGVHEGTHATDSKSNSALSPQSPSSEREKLPRTNQDNYLQTVELGKALSLLY